MAVAMPPLGVSLHTIERKQGLETIRLLEGSLVKAVELWEPDFDKSTAFTREARRIFLDSGVAVRTVHAAFGASLDLSSLQAEIREAGRRAVRVALDLAASMGAGGVVIHPSSEPIPDAERSLRLAESRRSIETIAVMALEAGCWVAVELLPRTCLGRDAAELVGLTSAPPEGTVGVCLDTNHLMDRFRALPDTVRSLGPRLMALHCSDYDGVDEKHWPPLKGVLDWPALIEALLATAFDGPFHYEAALEGDTPAQKLAFLEANYRRVADAWERRP